MTASWFTPLRLMFTITASLPSLVLLFAGHAQSKAIVFNSWQPLVTARLDPVMSPGRISEHVHHVVGGANFAMSYDPDTVRGAGCSTLQIQEDKSNYWTPPVYGRFKNGSYISFGATSRVYYTFPDPDLDPSLSYVAFPYSFQMVGGSPSRKTFNGSIPVDTVMQYLCFVNEGDSHPLEVGDPANYVDGYGIPLKPCHTIITKVFFPSCWNGKAFDLKAPSAHMAYGGLWNGIWGPTCPTGYPYRTIQIQLETYFHVADFGLTDNSFDGYILANGDTTGFGLHGDFQNGWNQDLLETIVRDCRYAPILDPPEQGCPALAPYINDPVSRACSYNGSKADEQTEGILSALPGCNLPWGNTATKPSCSSTSSQPASTSAPSDSTPLFTSGASSNVVQIPLSQAKPSSSPAGPRIIGALFKPVRSKRIVNLFKPVKRPFFLF